MLFANPFYCALALIVNLASLAVLFLLLNAEFVAAAQVLVYAGAVVIMFLFVTAYLGGREFIAVEAGTELQSVASLLAAAAIAAQVIVVIGLAADDRLMDTPEVTDAFGSPASIGTLFLTDHLLAFEVTSIILLVAAVGGVILGSTDPPHRDEVEDAGVLGPGITAYLVVSVCSSRSARSACSCGAAR